MKHWHAGAVLLGFFASSAVYGQTADQALQFEVASVKPVPPNANGYSRGCFGGPGSSNPGRYTCSNVSVSHMVITAYGVEPYRVRPLVITDTNRFDVEAKVPPGSTAEQVRMMLRNVLAERFKLKFHNEKIETQGYALVVAKGGLKLKESTPPLPIAPPDGDAAKPKPQPRPVTDSDGFTYFVPREGRVVSHANGLTRWVGNHLLMEHLAGLCNSLTGRPVIDVTGLKGRYDFIWTFSSDSIGERAPVALPDDGSVAPADETGLSAFAALEKQLGLRLEPRKISIDAFVIDHAEKTPVEN